MSNVRTFAFLGILVSATASLGADLSGTWSLNVAKSRWGTRPKPISVTIQIHHQEPVLTYSGVVLYSGEDARTFEFSGATDGKAYAMERSFGGGNATLRWVDATTLQTVFRTPDGNTVETTETSISRDGKTLTRRIRLSSAGTTSTSTEVYDRQPGT